MENRSHPTEPRSNVAKVGSYDPNLYALANVVPTVLTDEALTPNRPPFLTQNAIGRYLKPVSKDLDELPPRPTIEELPDPVIDRLMRRDKAFWVDKPGANAYVLHDAYYRCGMTTDQILPAPQAVFPRSYQYDLDCVRYRRLHACNGRKPVEGQPKNDVAPYCRDCSKNVPTLTQFELSLVQDATQKRWRYYPDLKAKMSKKEIQTLMNQVGRPFQSEACNWYNQNYPSEKYDVVIRKFSK